MDPELTFVLGCLVWLFGKLIRWFPKVFGTPDSKAMYWTILITSIVLGVGVTIHKAVFTALPVCGYTDIASTILYCVTPWIVWAGVNCGIVFGTSQTVYKFIKGAIQGQP